MKVYIPKYLKEKYLVDELEQVLTENGCFVLEPTDDSIEKGNHAEEIMKAIQRSDMVVSFLTPEALNSQGWRRELEFAQKNGKGIILLKVLEYEDVESSPAYEAASQYPIMEWGVLGKEKFKEHVLNLIKEEKEKGSGSSSKSSAEESNQTIYPPKDQSNI